MGCPRSDIPSWGRAPPLIQKSSPSPRGLRGVRRARTVLSISTANTCVALSSSAAGAAWREGGLGGRGTAMQELRIVRLGFGTS
jgi:hypothetical protein